MTFKHLEDEGKKSTSQVSFCSVRSSRKQSYSSNVSSTAFFAFLCLKQTDDRQMKSNFVHAISSRLVELWVETDKLPTSESKFAAIIDVMAFIIYQAG